MYSVMHKGKEDMVKDMVKYIDTCDGFSHVVSHESTMQVNRKTSCFCMQDKEPLLLRVSQ
jgi:hypothetical protein